MHIGVDTHKKRHVLVALDERGHLRGTRSVANTPAGWAAAPQWAHDFDPVRISGIEDSGSLGKGFARFLLTGGETAVHEIVPHRTARYRKRGRTQDKTDHTAYAYFSGTSMATPHVAGLAALLWATGWGASAQAVAARILATADPIAGATGLYWQTGRIDAARAVAGPPPAATALSPSSLPAGGGPFTLTVTGSNFVSGAVVRWNGAPRPTAFAGGAKVAAAIPASDLGSAGSASVTVANPDGGVTAALTFAITASPPRPTGIAPPSGSANGGTTVTMGGGYFRAGASVRIGGAAARVQSVTDTAITATTPAHAPGTVDVVVTNPDGQSGTLVSAFTYAADPLPLSRPQPSPAATGTPAPLPPARATAATNGPAGAANGSPAPLPSRR